MKIIVAKTAGFCMGVRRAVELVLDKANGSEGPICTFGPLIHNPQVLNLLREKGVPVLEDIPEKGTGIVLIRAHGVPPSSKQKLKDAGFEVIDATCPRVIKVQSIIAKHAAKGFTSIIIGDEDHPEVEGLLGYAEGSGISVNTMEALENLPPFENAVIVAQTTQNTSFFGDVTKWVTQNHPQYKIFNTICDSTERRQAEIAHIAKTADLVVVAGGKNSGNTQRLAEIVKEAGKPVLHIEEASELHMDKISFARTIAITAGASTPNWVIKNVYKKIDTALLHKNDNLFSRIFTLLELCLRTNLFQAAGAASLCFACTKLQSMEHSMPHALIAMLYVLSMQIFNNLASIKSDRYNNPDRASFYSNNMACCIFVAFTCGAAGLFLAYGLGILPFIILLIMSLLGLSYNLKILPNNLFSFPQRRIKDIPGSKTILIATAWGIVTSILPSISSTGSFGMATFLTFFLSTGMVFARTAFFDIMDMQGDRITGRETIPILIGNKKSFKLIKTILITTSSIILAAVALHQLPSLGLIIALFPISMLVVIMRGRESRSFQGIKAELMLQSHFIAAGIAALLWSFLSGL